MRPIAIDVARSLVSLYVCVSVCLCFGRTGELRKNG